MSQIFEKVLDFIKAAHIPYRHIHHSPTYTSEESAKARGEELDISAKDYLNLCNGTICSFSI